MRFTTLTSSLTLILSIFAAPSVQATATYQAITSRQTPVLVGALEKGIADYQVRYKSKELNHFWFTFDLHAQGKIANVSGIYLMNPELPLAEIKGFVSSQYTEKASAPVLAEFDHVNADLAQRGFEPSVSEDLAPSEEFVVFNQFRAAAGPQREVSSGVSQYIYAMTFELRKSYQRKGHALVGGESYPVAILRGSLYYRCAQPTMGCQVANAWIDEAAVAWKSVPEARGGISSAGGMR